jgi:TonB family protein
MKQLLVLATIGFALVGGANAHAREPVKGTEGDPAYWVHRPTGADFARIYSSVRGGKGVAVLRCTLDAQGMLMGCQVVSEAPEGRGYGSAALKIVGSYRSTLTTQSGKSVAGTSVEIPVGFDMR